MKILVVNELGYPAGGAEQVANTTIEALRERGHEVRFACSSFAPSGVEISADHVLRETGHWKETDTIFQPVNYLKMRRLLSDFRPDVVHFHNIFVKLSASVVFACSGVRSVVTLHDYSAICYRDKMLPRGEVCTYAMGSSCLREGCISSRPNIRTILKQTMVRRALGRIGAIVSPSRYLKQEFERNGYRDVIVIPNPVRIDSCDQLPELSRSRSLLYLGRLHPQKGVDVLIDAMRQINTELAGVQLTIAGTGPEDERLRRMVEDFGLSSCVSFAGWVSGKEKEALIRASRLVVAPSLWPENDAMTKYEAAKLGRPSVMSSIGGNAEFIKHGETGFLVGPGNAKQLAEIIVGAIDDEALLERMRVRLFTTIREFGLDRYAERLLTVYAA